MSVSFEFEWLDPAGAAGPELRATWARLTLLVDGKPITELVDRASRAVRTSIFLPLYPLAEWMVSNWWFLLHEIEPRDQASKSSFSRRHDLRFGGEGFALPSLSITPAGERIRLGWRPIQLPAQRVEFIRQGTAFIEIDQFQHSIFSFIEAVLRRLAEAQITETFLRDEFQQIASTDPNEAEFCAAAAALGLDPYSLPEERASTILEAGERIPAGLAPDFFSSADPERLSQQVGQIVDAIEATRSNTADLLSLKELRPPLYAQQQPASPPWIQGYSVARHLRNLLQLDGQPLQTFQALSRALRLQPEELARARSVLGTDGPFDALVALNDRSSPGFAIAPRSELGQRFALCRGLFEYLAAPEGEAFLVTRTYSERQKRNRAFAAEFLAPAESLRRHIHGDMIDYDQLDEIALRFGVSPSVIQYQIVNHNLAVLRED